jgi:ABC-type bacteriocin/lantibiotic exporter with double-glycine peptidase domain
VQEQPTEVLTGPASAPDPAMRMSYVRYQYPGASTDALAEVSLDVPAGSCVAVLGEPGSGKSTLLRLLRGQLEPTSGEIRYQGRADWQLDPALRHRIALVTEEPAADTSVAGAIARDRPSAVPAEIVAAATAAGAAEFVDLLPERYETRLGPRGYPLSSARLRRLSLARALLAQPDVLLLDEPTAGLSGSERHEMVALLCRLAAGRVTLVLATSDPLVRALADQELQLGRAPFLRSTEAPSG